MRARMAARAVVEPMLISESRTTVSETKPIARNGTWCLESTYENHISLCVSNCVCDEK